MPHRSSQIISSKVERTSEEKNIIYKNTEGVSSREFTEFSMLFFVRARRELRRLSTASLPLAEASVLRGAV
jgi:hypothetical protein